MMIVQKNVLSWLVGAAGVLILASCQEGSNGPRTSAVNCGPTGWYERGFEDGSLGYSFEKFEDYRGCPTSARPQPYEAYRAGWDAGIDRYCTEENGFVVAANGVRNPGTCPRWLAKSHKSGRKLGEKLFDRNQDIAEKVSKLEVLDRSIQSGRYSPDQVERLVKDRRSILDKLEKDERKRDKLLRKAQKRGYPL